MRTNVSNPYVSAGPSPPGDSSGVKSRMPMICWTAGTFLPAVLTALISLIECIIPELLPAGLALDALMILWVGGWFVASVASFNFKLKLSDKFALCFISSILTPVLMVVIIFVMASITGDMGQ